MLGNVRCRKNGRARHQGVGARFQQFGRVVEVYPAVNFDNQVGVVALFELNRLFQFAVCVLDEFLTAIALVAAGWGIGAWISPRSYNPQKGETYECGIPTRGRSWMQFKAGYYLFAILFLMFDVETVFLFPWAVVVRDMGIDGLLGVLFFLVVLVLGLAYAWRKNALEWK